MRNIDVVEWGKVKGHSRALVLFVRTGIEMLKIAILLETLGFFFTAILVFFIKWNLMKPKADRVKSYIVEYRSKLIKSLEPVAWILSHLATEGGKMPYDNMKPWQAPLYLIRLIIHTILIAPLLLIILVLLMLPVYTIVFLSRHNAITNSLIFIGTAAVLTGLILELIVNW